MSTRFHDSKRTAHSPSNLFPKVLLSFLLLVAMATSAFAGDSTYGTITEVKSPDIVVLDCGQDKYTVRLIGIDAPTDPLLAKKGVQMLSSLILKKRVHFRFEFRDDKLEMVGRILTLQTAKVDVQDAGEVLVRAGLARRQDDFDYKCGCLVKAETAAKQSKVGIWAAK